MRDRLNEVLADRYTVERELGRGGMASVWLARDLRDERPVAIKVLHPELAGAIGVDRFLREIRLTAGLQHPNIIPVLDSGVLPGPNRVPLPWYAMTYLAGESLRDRLDRERQLPIEEALRITEEAAAALAAAHREGIVHRDIKPENLLLAGGHVYVADFGIAKALIDTGGTRLTSTGLAIGTPAYMSPEQATAEAIDARSDQYSLASVLYEMLAGEPPFTGPTAQAVVARRLAEPARAIRPVRSSVSAGVEAAVLRALERVPTDRFADVSGFAAALRNSAPRRPPTRWIAGTLALVAMVALTAWVGSRGIGAGRNTRDPEVLALYQRGVRGYDKRTPAGASDAIQAFTAAIERDSTFAGAWAGLAKTYVRAYERRFVFPGVARDSGLRLGVAALDRALALDRRDADAWLTQGIVSMLVDPTDHTLTIRALRQSLALDSTSPVAWHFLARAMAESGDLAAAMAAWDRSVRADPSYAQGLAFFALGYYWRRQYDSAAYWADRALAVDPNYLLGRTTAGYVAIERDSAPRARAAFEAARRLSTEIEVVNTLASRAVAEARGGDALEARRTVQAAEALAVSYTPAPLHTAIYLAQAHTALGDRDRAVAWLNRFAPVADLHFQLHLRCDPTFEPLGGDPRFRLLLVMPRPEGPRGC